MTVSVGPKKQNLIWAVIIIAFLIGAIGSWAIWHNQSTSQKSSQTPKLSVDKPKIAANPYAGWQTFTDNSTPDSGISFKYPSPWKPTTSGKAYAWQLVNSTTDVETITGRTIFLPASTTPEQEWTKCSSADACGPAPGDTVISAKNITANGLVAYQTQESNSSNTYYTTVFKSPKPTSDGTAFVELTINNPDAQALVTYQKIVQSVSFN
ncbi:MAG TPA: hypothetical protein VG604_01755 [Candidatus Saccharimonadales bacterium]|nr:hypothetical protein [Candidatus Saccharimonadales bacterium]